MGRSDPLKIYGPKGAKNMHTNIIEAYQPDIDYQSMVHSRKIILDTM